MSFETSYQAFSIKNKLSIIEGKGSFPLIKIDNEYANASISIYGAQVLSYKQKSKPKNTNNSGTQDRDLLFVSELANFEQGKAIKGGIPICWPWFGKDPENADRQMHGFARNMLWKLEETAQLDTGETRVILSLNDSEETHKLWPHNFTLTLTIEIGSSLKLSLKTANTDNKAFKITQALHTYFSIADISQTQLVGLDGVSYLDKVTDADQPKEQEGVITINEEVDRIYIDAPSQLTLLDTDSEHKVAIRSNGSNTTVVWNPWIDISKKSSDLSDDAYLRFICVETANAAKDVIAIEPNKSCTIEAEYTVI